MRSHFNPLARSIAAGADMRCFGPALDTITATGTAIGATLAAATIATGDSFQIKNQAANVPAWLLQIWADMQVAGEVRVRSPKFHDNVDAIRSRVQIGLIDPLLPWGAPQPLYSQDVLAVELAGSAVGGDIESAVMQVYYPDLPGQAARLMTWDQIKSRIRNIVGQRLAITLGSTAGYNGARAINADTDLLQANQDYAVLGMTTNTECAAVCLRGPDTGNLRCAVPGEPALVHHTNTWFKRLSISYGLPLIPVINSANKGGTLVDCVNDENAGTANVVIWLAQLGS
jgi:hypothetical protein